MKKKKNNINFIYFHFSPSFLLVLLLLKKFNTIHFREKEGFVAFICSFRAMFTERDIILICFFLLLLILVFYIRCELQTNKIHTEFHFRIATKTTKNKSRQRSLEFFFVEFLDELLISFRDPRREE